MLVLVLILVLVVVLVVVQVVVLVVVQVVYLVVVLVVVQDFKNVCSVFLSPEWCYLLNLIYSLYSLVGKVYFCRSP